MYLQAEMDMPKDFKDSAWAMQWNAAIEFTAGRIANKFSNLSKAVGKRLAKNDGPKPEDEVISLLRRGRHLVRYITCKLIN